MIVGLILLGITIGSALSAGALIAGASLGTAFFVYAATACFVGLVACTILMRRAMQIDEKNVGDVSAQQVS